jgi:hypothetical protein
LIALQQITHDFAQAWQAADARRPVHPRYGIRGYGVGPFEEKPFMRMLHEELVGLRPDIYASRSRLEVFYPESAETADLCVGNPGEWEWALELKYARMKRSDGKHEEAALSRVLSPYQESAIVDCAKVLRFLPAMKRAVIVVAYDYDDLPVEPLISDFELLARRRVQLGARQTAHFAAAEDAEHSIHRRGMICAWEVAALRL